MGAVLAVAWFAATATCFRFVVRAWKQTRPTQTIRVMGLMGLSYEYPRLVLWTPLIMVCLGGAALGYNIHVKAALPAIGFCLFFLVWLSAGVFQGWLLAGAVSKAKGSRA